MGAYFGSEKLQEQRGKTFYPVTWRRRGQGTTRTKIEDLIDLPRYITNLIESGEAERPGEFYVWWRVHKERPWIMVSVYEGTPAEESWIVQGGITGFDPTPYASPQEAVNSVAFLGLELGARLEFYATVIYLTYRREEIPTPGYSKESVEDLILDVVRRNGHRRLGRYDR